MTTSINATPPGTPSRGSLATKLSTSRSDSDGRDSILDTFDVDSSLVAVCPEWAFRPYGAAANPKPEAPRPLSPERAGQLLARADNLMDWCHEHDNKPGDASPEVGLVSGSEWAQFKGDKLQGSASNSWNSAQFDGDQVVWTQSRPSYTGQDMTVFRLNRSDLSTATEERVITPYACDIQG